MEKEPKQKPAEAIPENKPAEAETGITNPGYGKEAIAANCVYGMFENPLDGAEE